MPSFSLSFCGAPFRFQLVVIPCGLDMSMFSSCNPKFFADRHIHYPANPPSDHFHTDAVVPSIGLYRDVWIAAIASSRTSLATLTGVMCNTSQCELRSLRVNSGMLNVIRIVTYYTLPPLESPDSFWIAMAFSR